MKEETAKKMLEKITESDEPIYFEKKETGEKLALGYNKKSDEYGVYSVENDGKIAMETRLRGLDSNGIMKYIKNPKFEKEIEEYCKEKDEEELEL